VIAPLYGAYAALLAGRRQRGTLDLEITERRVLFDEAGTVAGIEPRERYDSHRLIEEFMIAANVAAAIELEHRQQPCMYRVHEDPDAAKVEALREVLDGLGLRLARGQVIRPRVFTRILEQVKDDDARAMVSELILRAQAQARYAPDNLGHFGLALTRYAHFTSPIRRYADLLVHRSLIAGLGLGAGGLREEDAARFEQLGEHISMTERRAAAAERDAVDRLTAAFLKERVGATFSARVSGVTRFGLFVLLDDSGADGLIPVSSLPDDYYVHDEKRHSLVGRRWGRSYRLGERHRVRLAEANPMTGGLIFTLVGEEDDAEDQTGFLTSGKGRSPLGKPGGTSRSLRRKARGRRR
jgi:ribonuclease R